MLHKIIRKITFFFVLFAFISHPLSSQELVKSEGTAQVEVLSNMSLMQAKDIAKELAIINALERAFGQVVVQGNSTYITNLNTGEQVETKSVFNMIANTIVKGEVQEILKEDYKVISIDDKPDIVECSVKIKALEITTPKAEFQSATLVCPDKNCKTTSFKSDDDFYIYFTSPVSGYLSIFLDDGKFSSCLLPFSNMSKYFEGGFPIEANKEYILFSSKPEHYYNQDEDYHTENYALFAESAQDLNRVFILFTKSSLIKPILQKDQYRDKLSKEEIEQGYEIPRSTTSESFQKWLNYTRSLLKENMQVDIIDISITGEK
jgi:hypothetical protein